MGLDGSYEDMDDVEVKYRREKLELGGITREQARILWDEIDDLRAKLEKAVATLSDAITVVEGGAPGSIAAAAAIAACLVVLSDLRGEK